MRTAPPKTVTSPNPEQSRRKRARKTVIDWVFPSPQQTVIVGTVVVGRDETCDTRLPGQEVSRRHAELSADGPVVGVRDLDSHNGVFVNGARVTSSRLSPGAVLRCGEWVGIVGEASEMRPEVTAEAPHFGEIAPRLFGGPALAATLEPLKRLSDRLRVVVQGETGTGKEDTARALHAWSGRRGKFVPINCATLRGEPAENQLFGHVRGAFTGADRASQGLFRAAHGGTLFLDEVIELPPSAQGKLLRIIESGSVLPLGETEEVPADVRVVAAAQVPLDTAVENGKFRADLRARLAGYTVVLPPLRERKQDIVPLFLRFLQDHARGRHPVPRIDARLIETLCRHDWLMNVRELKQEAESLLDIHDQETVLERAHLSAKLQRAVDNPGKVEKSVGAAGSGDVPKPKRQPVDDETQYAALMAALKSKGSVAEAADAIDISRARAYRLMSARKGS